MGFPRGVDAFLVITTTLAAGTYCPSRKAMVRSFRSKRACIGLLIGFPTQLKMYHQVGSSLENLANVP